MAYTKYSLTPANNNATPPDGAPEGMLPSAVNDTMRDMMAQIRDVGDGIRNGTYTMTAPVITGGSITGVALSGNTFTNPVITGGSINNTPIGASTANTGAFTTLSASGVATFSAGTVSAPAITTTGDTNTGIFFPAADTIAFTEGGAESMRIDSSGNVGIGITSPTTKLQVQGGDAKFNTTSGSCANFIETASTSGGNTASVRLKANTYNYGLYVADNSDAMVLYDYARSLERMRIDSSGNVGIGNTPAGKLDVGSTSASFTDSIIRSSTTGTSELRFADTTINAGFIGYEHTADAMKFGTATAERMRIDSSGNVGIGTTAPNSRLEVNQTVSFANIDTYAQLVVKTTSGVNGKMLNIGVDETNNISFIQSVNRGTSANSLVLQRYDGNVGIGTSSPGQVLEVSKSQDTETQVRVVNANTGSSARSGFVLGNNSNAGAASLLLNSSNNTGLGGANALNMYQGLSAPIAFFTNATERMRITSDGEVCINSTSSTFKLRSSGVASAHFGDDYDSGNYGVVQITRPANQPDNKYHLAFIRNGNKITGLGFLDNSDTFAIQNASNSNNTGSGVTLTNDATSWGTTSDERKKDIIGNVENALTKIADWRSVYYKYKNDKEDAPQRVGLIAQDVQATLPEAVSVESDEMQTLQLRYTETIPLLVKAIQELKAELDATKAEVALLKSK